MDYLLFSLAGESSATLSLCTTYNKDKVSYLMVIVEVKGAFFILFRREMYKLCV